MKIVSLNLLVENWDVDRTETALKQSLSYDGALTNALNEAGVGRPVSHGVTIKDADLDLGEKD